MKEPTVDLRPEGEPLSGEDQARLHMAACGQHLEDAEDEYAKAYIDVYGPPKIGN
ncbi:hypothetical protein H5P28_11850 [Ruficoccus amylovorans]|uniref:Uncharacterized protein n=1 Tax=Ruficoccus amylovorans TaxID=1804625 RepID=A0A842HIA0_9BACT|nr:hypothetical protein [Ruficoccus amylovorans]MBC2594951.1 hypothetical protein [Ruficoccus amylovorans]